MTPFVLAYLQAALWAETQEDGTALDATYGIEDLSPDVVATAERVCAQFQTEAAALLTAIEPYQPVREWSTDEQNGHDFYLTRNRHGVGFWVRGYPDELGDALTAIAHRYGEATLYVDDDGQLHSYDSAAAWPVA